MRVLIKDELDVSVSRERALQYLQEIPNLERYEPKVRKIRHEPGGAGEGFYVAKGRFAGLPWKGRFDYVITPDGFHSKLVGPAAAGGLPSGVQVQGGFVVKERGTGATVCHWEEYRLPRWGVILAPALRLYLKASIRKELEAIRSDLER